MPELTAALLTLASAPPYSIGYGIGLAARALAWLRASFMTGYRRGRGLTD